MPPETISEAMAALRKSRGQRITGRIEQLGLDPKTAFAGGDWRNCNFTNCDLTDCDFSNSRLFFADFKHALVTGADFTGAGDVHTAKIHLAYGWQDATFEDYQRVLIEAKISTMNDYHGNNSQLRRSVMNEKDSFYAIKACPSFREARDVLKQMETAGHRLNAFAYSYVLDRAKRDHQRKDGWALFDYFFDEGGKIDEALYTAAMGVSPDSKTALDVFDAMREAMAEQGEVPGERAYNMAISEQDNNFAVALSLFHEMKRKGVAVSRYTVYALFDACQSFANAVTVMMEARRSDVEINDASFVEELCNSTRYPELNDWNIKQWQAEGLSHHDVIVRLVDSISGDPFRSDALEVLRRKPTPPPS